MADPLIILYTVLGWMICSFGLQMLPDMARGDDVYSFLTFNEEYEMHFTGG